VSFFSHVVVMDAMGSGSLGSGGISLPRTTRIRAFVVLLYVASKNLVALTASDCRIVSVE